MEIHSKFVASEWALRYLRDAASIDSGDDDGRVTTDAEPVALVFPFPEPDNSRSCPMMFCWEDGNRAEATEQVLDFVLAEVRIGQTDLEVGLGYDGWRIQDLLNKNHSNGNC